MNGDTSLQKKGNVEKSHDTKYHQTDKPNSWGIPAWMMLHLHNKGKAHIAFQFSTSVHKTPWKVIPITYP